VSRRLPARDAYSKPAAKFSSTKVQTVALPVLRVARSRQDRGPTRHYAICTVRNQKHMIGRHAQFQLGLMRRPMKIVPEKVFVHANQETAQLTVVMEGYRLTLAKAECEALRDGLSSGLKQLELTSPEPRRTPFVATDSEVRRVTPAVQS
jgi:hypothetical protein